MKIKLILFSLIFFLAPISMSAQDTGWVIESFDVDIRIDNEGVISVREQINVDFNNLQKHGIFRYVPTINNFDDGRKEVLKVDINSVIDDEGDRYIYEVSNNSDHVFIKIGDPNKTITGKNSYIITYEVNGALRGFEDFDELYWDVTGNEWPVPILQSSVTVTTPEGVDIEKSACYVGLFNSTDNCNQIFSVNNTKTTFVHNDPLNPGEGLTIASGWNSGEIAFQVFKYKPLFLRPEGLTFLITLIVGLLLIIGNWYKNGRDYMYTRNKLYEADRKEKLVPLFHKDAITTYFEPPENLRPGMLGLLIDERVDSVDITSTIIDLASRGYLQIKEIEKGKFKKLFTGADYLLIEKEGADFYSLSDYEKEIFNSIFKHGTEVKLSELKTKFHKDYQDITKMMYKEATDRGYFVKNPYKYRIMGVSAFALFFIMTFFVGPITSAFSGSQFTKILISFFIAFGILSLVYTIFAVKMTQKTAKGRELYVESLGYRTFIKSTEKYRAKFYEDENMFMKTLPYAITFGMTKKFYNAMKDMGIQPQNVGWYVPVGDFNPDSFAESLESMTTMMSSTTSTSSGSGSGGGGFSGGGAGGGGGGSW